MRLLQGEIIQSRYRLVSLKGRGSFGEVWLARDEQTDMDVAVKVYIALDDRGLEEFKADNVLVGQDGNFVITDFGVSSKMKSTLRRNSTRAMSGSDISGTIGYMAPELFSRTPVALT